MTSFPQYDMNEFRSVSADMKPSQVLPDSLVIPGKILKGTRRKLRWKPKINEVCEALKVNHANDIYYVCTIVRVRYFLHTPVTFLTYKHYNFTGTTKE